MMYIFFLPFHLPFFNFELCQVKPKIWTAHVNGKKHKDSCERLKQQLVSGAKRPHELSVPENGTPPVKKLKGEAFQSIEAITQAALLFALF